MKIIDIHKTTTAEHLLEMVNEKLDPLFAARRGQPMHFTGEINNGAIEIHQRALYEGFLYRIEIAGHELHITRNEHYVDDVNSLTVESILNEIFSGLSGGGKVNLVLEG
jgi:hypothetical protein